MVSTLVERIDAIEPVITAHRDEAERRGRLSEPAVAAMIQAGVARLYLPESLGGLEVDPLTCASVTESLARMDTAAAWFVMVANAARLMAQYWPESLVEEVWGDNPDTVVAASGNKPFHGVSDAGGYILNGVNGFVSGCHHAQWLLSPARLDGEFAMIVVPMGSCEIVDNWHALGMRGTGSNDVRLVDVRVPPAHVVTMGDPARKNRYFQGALFRCPSRILFATYLPVMLVLAERALEELTLLAHGKTPYAEDRKLRNRSIAQVKYARALGTFRASRGYFLAALGEAWERASEGGMATDEQKADLYLAGTHAAQSAAQVVRWVADAAGTSVIYQAHPLERIVRDMETLRHHGFISESRYGSVAQVYWDTALDYPLMLR
jgi:alkylation response protein AidB-like acyl-CoA dehydrogenase